MALLPPSSAPMIVRLLHGGDLRIRAHLNNSMLLPIALWTRAALECFLKKGISQRDCKEIFLGNHKSAY